MIAILRFKVYAHYKLSDENLEYEQRPVIVRSIKAEGKGDAGSVVSMKTSKSKHFSTTNIKKTEPIILDKVIM